MIIDKYYAIRIFACKKLITAQNAQNGGNKFPKSYKAVVCRFKKSENGSANASVLLLYLIAINGWGRCSYRSITKNPGPFFITKAKPASIKICV